MSGLEGIETKWHRLGKKEMLIKNIVTLASVKFEMDDVQVESLLNEELKKVQIEDSRSIIKCLIQSSSLFDFKNKLNEINNKI